MSEAFAYEKKETTHYKYRNGDTAHGFHCTLHDYIFCPFPFLGFPRCRNDDAFSYAYEQTSDPAEYYRLVHKELLLTALKPIWTGETLDVSFQVEINDSQALLVTIDVLSPQQVRETGAKAFYNILSWQIIRTDTWEGDDTLKLFQEVTTSKRCVIMGCPVGIH